MGTAELSCASLEMLARDRRFSVAAVVTQPDKPKGRDLKLQPSPVKLLAEKLQLPVLQPAKARDEQFIGRIARIETGFDRRRRLRPDFAAGNFGFAAVRLLERPHLAPAQISRRRADPVGDCQRRRRNRRDHHENGRRPRHRPDACRPPHADSATDDSQTLHDRLAQLGAELLVETIPDYVAGKISPQPQPAEGASYAAKIKKEDGRIDWSQSAKEIWNRLRAFTPWPGAFTFLPDAKPESRNC